jgi:uncharacterized membrane protein YbhN (UPF0104 family)
VKLSRIAVSRRVALISGWLASTALLIVLARTIDRARTADVVAAARPAWIVAAVLANAGILFGMAAFWLALRPRGEPPVMFRRIFEIAATASALMNTVPFGAGHASVVLLLISRGNTSRRGAVSVLALDQLGEGLSKVGILLLAAFLVPLPVWMRAGAGTTSFLVAVLLVALVAASRWTRELRILYDWRRSAGALACVLATKVCEALAIVAVQHAFGVDVAASGTLLVLAAVILGTILPFSPGNLGTYEASVFLAYRYLGVGPEQALSLAVAQHVCFMLPSVGVGYLFFSAQTVSRSAIASR